jgi:predicted PurR-regulated permease PerM
VSEIMPTSDSNPATSTTPSLPATLAVDEEPPPQRVELHIPWLTFIKVAAVLLAAYAVYVLWSLLLLVFLAFFLAVTLHAFVDWLDGKGLRHWASLLIVIGGLLTTMLASASRSSFPR